MRLSSCVSSIKDKALFITENLANLNLRTWAISNGWDGVLDLTVTINSGVTLYGSGAYGLTINGSFPKPPTLIIQSGARIVGYGGAGGNYGDYEYGRPSGGTGGDGGAALLVQVPVKINNIGIIGGGGGGGGGGGYGRDDPPYTTYRQGGIGGMGAGIGSAGAGSGGNAGAGGSGSGGALGSAGYAGGEGYDQSAGGWQNNGGAGGSGGAAVNGNTNITWIAVGTRYGSVS